MFKRFLFSSDRDAFRDTVCKFVAEHIFSYPAPRERDAQIGREACLLVACTTNPKRDGNGASLVLAEAGRRVLPRGPSLEKTGWKAQGKTELFFDYLRVSTNNLIGGERRGFVQRTEKLEQKRLIKTVRCASAIKVMLQWAVDFITVRNAFGRDLLGCCA